MIRNILKKSPFLYTNLLKIKHRLWTKKTIKYLHSYLLHNADPKLQFGAGQNILPGWFNTDYFPRDNIFFIDVTKPIPISSNLFKYVFSEHHIEHISYKDATTMLREAFRIMKPGGYIKINTPDLEKYINQYSINEPSALVDLQIKNWIYTGFYNASNYIPVDDYANSHFINDIFLNYSHQFIYDFESLKRQLLNAGFININKCDSNVSAISAFNGILAHNTLFDYLFTLSVEAQKPTSE